MYHARTNGLDMERDLDGELDAARFVLSAFLTRTGDKWSLWPFVFDDFRSVKLESAELELDDFLECFLECPLRFLGRGEGDLEDE